MKKRAEDLLLRQLIIHKPQFIKSWNILELVFTYISSR